MSLAPLASRYLPSSLTAQMPSLSAFGRSASSSVPTQHLPTSEQETDLMPPLPDFAARGKAGPQAGPGADPRLSTLLPSITCSSCGIGLRMEELGEHVCEGNAAPGGSGMTTGPSSHRSGASSQLRSQDLPSRSRNRSHDPASYVTSSNTSGNQDRRGGPSNHGQTPSDPSGKIRALAPARSMTTPVPVMTRDTEYVHPSEQSQRRTQGDAGMAGVGRRQFGSDQGLKPFAHPTRPHTPPHAFFSVPPSLPNGPAQNQSQPYHIASQGENHAYPQRSAQGQYSGSYRPEESSGKGSYFGGYNASSSQRSADPAQGGGHISGHGGRHAQAPPGELAGRRPEIADVPRSVGSNSSGGHGADTRQGGYPRPPANAIDHDESQRGHASAHRRRPSGGDGLRVDTSVAGGSGAEAQRNRGVQLKESYAPGAKVSPDRPSFGKARSTEQKPVAPPPGSWKATAASFLGHKKSTTMPDPAPAESTHVDRSTGISTSASQPQAVSSNASGGGGGNKLPFFERYRQMTDASAPGSLARTMSNSGYKPAELSRTPSNHAVGVIPVFDDVEQVESPIAALLEVDEESSSLPWARQSMSKQQRLRPEITDRQERKDGRVKKSDDGSMSSLDQATADRMNVGQMPLLTPSTSMDELEDRSRGPLRVRNHSTTPPPGDPRDTLRQDSFGDAFLSPNASYPGSRRDSQKRRHDRDSSASSLLAPSDSISTPGVSPFPGLDSIRHAMPRAGSHANGGGGGPGKSGKVCQKCGDSLKGKRYIERDGISLCERDWKEIYLPKCRRCKLPIETSAVSSSDGQLRGKWHRQCFTCFKCDEPFDGETFYVHADRPYCQMHYHQANGTLCASTSCQQPIEGPCLLTSANQRYHPGHLRCSHRGSTANGNQRCEDQMSEYFEIGRLKVCESHKEEALRIASKSGKPTTRAEKRKTRLIGS